MNALTPAALAATTSLSSPAAATEARKWPVWLFPVGQHPGFDPHSDGALIAACEAYPAVHDAFMADESLDDDAPTAIEWRAALDFISNSHPTTMAGVRAKARAAKHNVTDRETGKEELDCTRGADWAWQIVGDVLRISSDPTAQPVEVGDGSLIATCDEHVKRMAAYNATPEDSGPLFDAMMETHDAIMAATPQTAAELLAKARATRAEGVNDGDFTSSGTEWGWQVAMDLLRMVEEGTVALMSATQPETGAGDAALIAAAAALPARLAAFNASEDDDCPEQETLDEVIAVIETARPVSMAGLVAKARAAVAEAKGGGEALGQNKNEASAWCWHLANDLIRLADEKRVASPDAALLKTAATYTARRDAYDAHEETGPNDVVFNKLVRSWLDAIGPVQERRAFTLEGLIAKARVAKRETAIDLDGAEPPADTIGDRIARSIVNDLLGMGAGA